VDVRLTPQLVYNNKHAIRKIPNGMFFSGEFVGEGLTYAERGLY